MAFTFVQLISLSLFLGATVVHGDRRGSPQTSAVLRARKEQSFSSQEQALFGSCTAEDCVLGPAMGNSYFQAPVEQVLPASKTPGRIEKDKQRDANENTTTKKGFGPAPAFVHQY